MGVLIKIENALFDEQNVIGTIDIPVDPVYLTEYPVQDTTLKGLYDLGGTLAASLVNHAPEANLTGETATAQYDGLSDDAEIMKENYIAFPAGGASDYRIKTYIRSPLANKVTAVALFSVPAGGNYGNRVIIGNRGGGTTVESVGISMLNDCVRFATDGALTQQAYEGGGINSASFAILAIQASADGVKVVRYTNGELSTLQEFSGSVDAWSTNALQIGGCGDANQYDAANIAFAAMHEGEITDTQLEEICAFANAYGRYKGLTIE